ncbi:MAG: hypothetical protein R6V10_07205 [bacterium]
MMKKLTSIVVALVVLTFMPFAAQAGKVMEGLQELAGFRYLWPAEPTTAGGELTELSATTPAKKGAQETPYGSVPAEAMGLVRSGEQVGEVTVYELPAGRAFQAFMIETRTKEEIKGPNESFEQPAFAAPAIRAPARYSHVLGFREDAFAPPTDEPVASMGPTVLYSDDMEVLVISSLNYFLTTIQSPVEDEWWCGFHGEIESIPAGTVFRTLVVKGRGMNETVFKWGDLLRGYYDNKRENAYADVGLSHLGYWTDNGAYYYYKTAPGMNYHDTLLAVKDYADREGIPYGYFQIDSWWYPKAKTNNLLSMATGGAIVWEPMKELFPQGLDDFQEELGLPLIAHNRWYDRSSPYCDRYECVYGKGIKSAALPIEDDFWNEIMDNAVSYGVEVYEQDWLVSQLYSIPWLRSGIDNAEKWFDAMMEKADERDLTVQLCMASPGFFLQQVKHDNVTQVRASGDYQAIVTKTYFWPAFHQTSMLAYAVGLWPFKDNFQTTPMQRPVRNEFWPYEETLVSVLSAGLVGPGDKLGKTDKELLMKTCREDGVLLKPDRPATPIDVVYTDKTRPWIVTTKSGHEAGETYYVAAFNLWPYRMMKPEVSMVELGISGDYVVYDYREEKVLDTNNRIEFGLMPFNDAFYYVLAPVLENGMAIIGETDKFVTMSGKRFPRVDKAGESLKMDVAGVAGEEVRVTVYTPERVADVSGGEVIGSSGPGLVDIMTEVPASGLRSLKIR